MGTLRERAECVCARVRVGDGAGAHHRRLHQLGERRRVDWAASDEQSIGGWWRAAGWRRALLPTVVVGVACAATGAGAGGAGARTPGAFGAHGGADGETEGGERGVDASGGRLSGGELRECPGAARAHARHHTHVALQDVSPQWRRGIRDGHEQSEPRQRWVRCHGGGHRCRIGRCAFGSGSSSGSGSRRFGGRHASGRVRDRQQTVPRYVSGGAEALHDGRNQLGRWHDYRMQQLLHQAWHLHVNPRTDRQGR